MNFALYFNCYFNGINEEKIVCTYKITGTKNTHYPFQLHKLKNIVLDQWDDLSIYATLNDAIKTLLHELFSEDIVEAINHGQSFLNTRNILKKIVSGKTSISIGALDHEGLQIPEYDIILEELIETQHR